MGGAGGAAGVLLGGILTDLLELALDPLHQRADRPGRGASSPSAASSRAATQRERAQLRPAGALTATLGLSLLVFGIVRTDITGWGDPDAWR